MGIFRKKQDAGSPDDDRPVDPNERAPQTGVKYKDLFVMKALSDAGADLSQPREIRYVLYFPDEASAQQAATTAADITFTEAPAVPTTTDDGQWSVVLVRHDVVDFDSVRDHDDFLTAMAADLGGTYDGWEASV